MIHVWVLIGQYFWALRPAHPPHTISTPLGSLRAGLLAFSMVRCFNLYHDHTFDRSKLFRQRSSDTPSSFIKLLGESSSQFPNSQLLRAKYFLKPAVSANKINKHDIIKQLQIWDLRDIKLGFPQVYKDFEFSVLLLACDVGNPGERISG